MPTGVAIRDVREHLFAAAERVLLRDGPSALTSRAVTTEAGVAKGVLHRHFADFDAFLIDLIRDRVDRLAAQGPALLSSAGTGTVTANVAAALADMFSPVALSVVGLIIFRDDLRARMRAIWPRGLPLLTDAAKLLSAYLAAERTHGRLPADADTDTLAMTLIGSSHLLFADAKGAPPPHADVERVIASVLRP